MQATIEHTEYQGGFLWLDTLYRVSALVTFDARELQIVRRNRLHTFCVLTLWRDGEQLDVTIRTLLDGTFRQVWPTPIEAYNYEVMLRSGLERTKGRLNAYDVALVSASFEV